MKENTLKHWLQLNCWLRLVIVAGNGPMKAWPVTASISEPGLAQPVLKMSPQPIHQFLRSGARRVLAIAWFLSILVQRIPGYLSELP